MFYCLRKYLLESSPTGSEHWHVQLGSPAQRAGVAPFFNSLFETHRLGMGRSHWPSTPDPGCQGMLRPEFEQLGSRHVEFGKQGLTVGPQQEY